MTRIKTKTDRQMEANDRKGNQIRNSLDANRDEKEKN